MAVDMVHLVIEVFLPQHLRPLAAAEAHFDKLWSHKLHGGGEGRFIIFRASSGDAVRPVG
jgi:hypothetical protein